MSASPYIDVILEIREVQKDEQRTLWAELGGDLRRLRTSNGTLVPPRTPIDERAAQRILGDWSEIRSRALSGRATASELRAQSMEIGRRLGDALGELGAELSPYLESPRVRLWICAGDGAGEWESLPWELLELADRRDDPRRPFEGSGWLCMRRSAEVTRADLPSVPFRKLLVIVGDLRQESGVRESWSDAIECATTLRCALEFSARVELALSPPAWHAAESDWRAMGVRDATVSGAALATWFAQHQDADALVWLGHAIAEAPECGSDAPHTAWLWNEDRGPDKPDLWTVPVVTTLADDDRPTLPEHLAGHGLRLAVQLGCATGPAMAAPMLHVADHVLGTQLPIPTALFPVAGRTLGDVLGSQRPGTAGELAKSLRHDARDSDLAWTVALWSAVETDRPFHDARTELLGRLVDRQLERFRAVEPTHHPGVRGVGQIAIPLRVIDDPVAASERGRARPRTRTTGEVFEDVHQRTVDFASLASVRKDDPARLVPKASVVRGPAGAGKTTSLEKLCLDLAAGRSGLVPVHASLRALTDRARRGGRDWNTFSGFCSFLDEEHAGELADALRAVDGEGRLVLLLDGLDETRELRDEVRGLVHALRSELPSAALILTTRPDDYRPMGGAWADYRLQALDRPEITALLERRYAQDLAELEARALAEEHVAGLLGHSDSFTLLMQIPLFVSLVGSVLVNGSREVKDVLATTRTRFLDRMIDHLLACRHRPASDRRPLCEHPDDPGDTDLGRDALAELALRMAEESRFEPTRDVLKGWLNGARPGTRLAEALEVWVGPVRFLRAVRDTGLLAPRSGTDERGPWRFLHDHLREALQARGMLLEAGREDALDG